MEPISVEKVTNDPAQVLAALVEESSAQGFGGLRRLVAEWAAGTCRFIQPGEGLLVALGRGGVEGVCAVDAAPGAFDRGVGRLREMYVTATRRRSGTGTALVRRILDEARGHFSSLELCAETPGAVAFYESIGFLPMSGSNKSTHRLAL
jgi:GNAT superfamily N-acetyltransferase